MKNKGQPFDITVIQVHAPTSTSDGDLEAFYEDPDRVKTLPLSRCHWCDG